MNKKVKFLSVAASMALAASLGTPALAENVGAVPVYGGTDVYAGVTTHVDAPYTNLKVTVPTLFSFVVATAADTEGTKAISVSDGNLLIPNVKVDDNGKVSTVGQSQMYFTNYSTKVTSASHEGLGVDVNGMVVTDAGSKWVYTPTAKPTEAFTYNLTLGGSAFNVPMGDGNYACAKSVSLAAPDVSTEADVTTTDKTAKVGKTQVVEIGVNVGGTTNDYTSNAAASAKVGTIVWTITATA